MPEQAFQVLGESLTRALIGNDFDLYQSILTLPMRFSPRDGKAYVLSDLAALREDFDLYVSIIRLHGVTDIYRQYLGSAETGPGEVVVTTMTHILVRANLLAKPFQSRLRLVQRPEGWRIAEIESSEGHLNWTLGRAEISSEGRFEPKTTET